TLANANAGSAYFDGALSHMRWWREGAADAGQQQPPQQQCLPSLGPLDKLRLELDEVWPEGASVRKNEAGRAFLAGVARVMRGPTRYVEGFMHVDELAPMVENRGTFSANVYLKVPPAGGELAIWPLAVRSRWDFYRHAETLSHLTVQGEEGQALLRRKFPPPRLIRVEPGDLVVLCVQRPHAAQGFPMGTRVSVQSFLTFEKGKALVLDN
ncbi:unnamed protein product, partial [Hapterophycus canaliculatus]